MFTKDAEKIFSKESFQKDGTYMDPMNTLLTLYSGIDLASELDICFSLQFNKEKTFRDTFIKIIKWFWQSKPKTEEGAVEKKDIKPDLFLEISIGIHSKDAYLIETTKANIKSAFSTFAEGGAL